jgi:hypothetical protein
MKIISSTLLFTQLIMSPAHATFICKATPETHLGVDASGNVLIWIESAGVVNICGLDQSQAGRPSIKACEAWYSAFLTAQASSRQVTLYFTESEPLNQGATTCAALGAWVPRSAYYFQTQ